MADKKTALNLRPLGDRVIVEGLNEMEASVSGIIIPETVSKERPQKGVIVAVGPGKLNKSGERVKMELKVGDKVVFSKYGPDEIEIDGHKYLILSESSIMAVIE
jgi:chaperonin GroES